MESHCVITNNKAPPIVSPLSLCVLRQPPTRADQNLGQGVHIKILLSYKSTLAYRDFNVSPIEITKYRRLPKNHRSKSVGNSVFCPKHLFLTAPSCLNQLNSAIPTYNLEWNHFGGKAIVVYRKSSLMKFLACWEVLHFVSCRECFEQFDTSPMWLFI